MSTRAINFLKKAGVPFDVITYDHQVKGAAYAARRTGTPLERTVKTLVSELGANRYVIALMPGNQRLDTKKLAASFGVKRAAMVDRATAERLTGYSVGGISPFGLKHPFHSIMHQGIMDHDRVLVNGGKRGTMLRMSPRDIARLLNCKIANIAR